MTDQPDENTTIRFLQDIPDGSFKKGEILTYTEEKAAAAVKNVESRYGKNYVEYIGKNVSVPTVPAVPPRSTSIENSQNGIKLEVAEQSEQSERKNTQEPNNQQERLIYRLKEGKLDTKRFLKVTNDKKPFETEWQKNLYGPESLNTFPRWGICGKDYLVLIDSDDPRMYEALSMVLPKTFEVTSPRRGLPHKYFIVPAGKNGLEVQNGILHIDGVFDEKDNTKLKALGENRAQNEMCLAPGTVINYVDKETVELKTGMYTITNDVPIARIEYEDFIRAIKPYFGATAKQKVTKEHIENGIAEGERATVLFQEACSLASFQKDGEYLIRQFILDALTVSAYRCKPPFDDHEELSRMVDNAIGYRESWEKKKKEQEEAKKVLVKVGSSNTDQQQEQQVEAISIADLNPILVAKRIMQLHKFVLEQDTKLLYVYDEKEGIFTLDAEEVIRKEMCILLSDYTRTRFYSDIENWIKYNPETSKVVFNPNPYLIAVKNGVLNLKDRTLKPFSPDYYLTNKIPHNFNPERKNGKIEAFCKQVMSEKHALQHQEFMGKTLFRKAIHQVAPVLNGEGNNGKSVLIDVDTYLLGKKNVTNVTFQALTYDKFASADLKDKMANFCADMPAEALKHLGTVKMIITSDSITSQHKHKDPFTWTPNLSMMFSCNHAPEIDVAEDNIGTFRRFMMWDFPIVFSPNDPDHPEDKHLRDKLLTEEEAEAYLNYCLDGLDKLLKNGDYTQRDSVPETRKAYIKKSNGCQAFTDEAIEITNDPEDWFFTDTAYRLYANYCIREKMPTMPKAKLSKAIEQFCNGAERFKRRPIGEKTGTPLSAWRYVKLKQLANIPTDQVNTQKGIDGFTEKAKKEAEEKAKAKKEKAKLESEAKAKTEAEAKKSKKQYSYCKIPQAERCDFCRGLNVEYITMLPDGTVQRKCERCFKKLYNEFKDGANFVEMEASSFG